MGFKRLERALTAGFRVYGHFVGCRPLPFFLVPLLITALLAPGLFFITYDDDVIALFTPYDAPSRHEQEVVKEFSYVQPLTPVATASYVGDRLSNANQSIVSDSKRYLLQTAKTKPRSNPWFFVDVNYVNESNIMNTETFRYALKFVRYIYHNFTCQVKADPNRTGAQQVRTLRYNPYYCNPEDPNGYECPKLDDQLAFITELLNRSADRSESSKIRLTYPVMYLLNRPVNWGHFIYGAETINKSNAGKLELARVLVLKLDFQFDLTEQDTYMAKQCMKQMTNFILGLNDGSAPEGLEDAWRHGLQFSVTNQWRINEEVALGEERTQPCIAATAILVTLYTLISSYYAKAPVLGAAEALLGVLAIGLSLAATFSFLFICGLPFNFITIMTPLLTLCVGIDNDFLLMSAWRRPHLEGLPVKQRLAHAFAEAGPSLTITSVNDILCFAVGCLSESPAITKFCLFTCIALTFRYLYQLTFFSGALVYVYEKGPKIMRVFQSTAAKLHLKKRRLSFDTKVTPWTQHQGSSTSVEAPREASSVPEMESDHGISEDNHIMHRFFRRTYSKFISRSWARVVIMLMFAAYLVLSFYSASQIIVNISVTKLFLDDSPMQDHYRVSQKYILTSVIGNVIVKNPPDFRNKRNIDRFLEFVGNLEKTPVYAPDPIDTTVLWLRDYLEFSSYVAEPGSDFYDYMSMFLEREEYSKYINDMRFNYSKSGKVQVESFAFSTYYRNVSTWDDSAKILLLWRRVCKNYSEYDAIVHDHFFRNSYLDQRLTLAGSTLQTMGIASLSIAFVTSLLMPDTTSIFFICFSSLSVDLGVIAILNAWGSDLDPITMACLLMTIGFSVYYTARICYCFQKVDDGLPLECKLAYTLGSVGWPILQGGLATLIGIVPLAFIHSYMVRTFFRTIVLVVFVGLLHGLLFMPVVMSLYDRPSRSLNLFAKKRREMRNASDMKKSHLAAYRHLMVHCANPKKDHA